MSTFFIPPEIMDLQALAMDLEAMGCPVMAGVIATEVSLLIAIALQDSAATDSAA